MSRAKRTGYDRSELNRLYKLTDSWTDISDSLTSEDVPFVVEDLCVYYALPARTASEVSRLAKRRRTTPEKLIDRWVREKLASIG